MRFLSYIIALILTPFFVLLLIGLDEGELRSLKTTFDVYKKPHGDEEAEA